MDSATVNTEEWALRLNKELTDARARITDLEAQLAEAKEDAVGWYAERLLIALMEKHYPDRSPEWAPLPDLMGILTQIDNLTAGLVRATPTAEAALTAAQEAGKP